MRFELLGPLRVIADDGSDVTPRGDQQRRVLTVLASAAPSKVSVDTLEDLLWDGPPPSANALQALVSKLRKVVAPVRIDGDGRGYSLVGELTTDLRQFEQHLAAGEYAAAERLVRGRPLHDLGDTTAWAAERARLAGLIRTAERHRLGAAVDGPAPLGAIAELEALVVADPLDEGWWGLLMRAQHRSGQQAEALRTYQRARRVLAEELGLSPGAELQAFERQILAGAEADEPAAPASAVHAAPGGPRRAPSLPARLSSFVGREHDLDALAAAIGSHRLVTLVGPGGTGKTTTALELARRLAPEAASFVALAPLLEREAIVRSLGRAIGLPDSDQTTIVNLPAEDPLDRVVAALSASSRMLLIDNCEHVIDDAAAVVHRLLEECPSVRVIATSRSSLSVPGEWVYPLPPLPDGEAVELFVARARDHAAVSAIESTSRDALYTLCERLDRLPLAIELAAARLRSMSIDELMDRLRDRFSLLSSGPRTVEPRQQTLRAVVDWSHDLLDPQEQLVFRRMAVFVGGATADAIERVASSGSADGPAPGEVLAIVDRLLDKSLIRAERTSNGTRYSMLQTLHDYASERLAASGEHESTLVRHAEYYAELVAGALKGLVGHEQREWLETIGRERQNIDAACETAIARQDAQLALELLAPLGWYFFMTSELESGADAFAEALACPGATDPELRALAMAMYGWLVSNGANVEGAVAATSEAMAMLQRVDDPWKRALIVNLHVMAMFFAGMVDRVASMLPELEAIAGEADDIWIAAITKVVEGEVLHLAGRALDAEQRYLEAAAAFEQVGDRFAYAITVTEASEIAEMFGEYDRAVEFLQSGIALADEVGFSGHPLAMRARLANIEIMRGNLDVAAAHHEELLGDVVTSGVPWLQAMALVGLSAVARRRDQFDRAEQLLEQAWALPRTRSVPHMRSIVLVARGYLADQQGEFPRAFEHQLAGLRTAVQLGTPRGLAYSLEGCAGALALSCERAHHELGASLLGAADQLRRGSGGPMPDAERYDVDRAEARLRAVLTDSVFDQAFERGAAAAPDSLVAAVESVLTTG